MIGWQAFDRPHDFHNFQWCDFVRKVKVCKVLIRKAKNNTKGVTRAPMMEDAGDRAMCTVEIPFT